MCVFTPPSGANAATELAAIQTVVNNIAVLQAPLSAQFNDDGYALLFEPGTYGSSTTPLVFQVGYYTEVAGLGAVPQDVVVNGQIDVFPNAPDSAPGPGNCYVASGQTCYWANSTVNFWRSLSNLTLNVMSLSTTTYVPPLLSEEPPINDGNCFAGPSDTTDFWSVSQATPVRSVIINGTLNFQSYCSETNYQSNNYGSGSYVANSEINGQLDWSGNQQGIARNSDFESAAGYVWNYVYSGDGCPPGYTPPAGTACSPTKDVFDGLSNSSQPGYIGGGTDGINGVDQVTELQNSPVTQEEPFLYTTSSGSWDAFVPAVQQNSSGPNFLSGTEAGSSVPLSDFFIASPTTPEFQIQGALNQGKDLVLTPGTYDLDAALLVSHSNSIVLGLGFPVLVPQRGNASMVVLPNNGVALSGMIFDAGPVNSPVLLSVGTPGPAGYGASDPDLIQDIYFRIGGAETTPVSATISLLDNADHSIIDDVWAWRADHGANLSVTGPEGQVGAGWTYNQGAIGLQVTGANVTAYGLAIEHYQKNEVVWSGNNGTAIFFQNELPYDPPSQTAWEASFIQPGYPSFLVSNNVQSFHGYGMGSYVVFIYTPAILWDALAYEAPNAPGVVFTDAMDLFISSTCSVNGTCPTPGQSGGLDSVIDGVGGSATDANPTTVVDVDSYANGVATLP
ncbi:MAG: adenylyl cyclase [Candidatus Dormibacteria bacterium]